MRVFSIVILAVLCASSAGWAGDGAVALQSADPSCRNAAGNRYDDCGNGTVTDNQTGLVWLKNANCVAALPWYTAMEIVAGLADLPGAGTSDDCGLSDGSSPGEWRLPSRGEWEEMVADAQAMNCSPTITNDAGDDCWDASCPEGVQCSSFDSLQSVAYWSSTSYLLFAAGGQDAWSVELASGGVFTIGKSAAIRSWPVRGGQ